jgi:hypothetical protein
LTLAFDFDHQRFIEKAPPEQGTGTTILFAPDTDRTTGTMRLNSRLGERAVIHGGLQVSSLHQERTRTSAQKASGLRENKLLFYSGNLATDLALTDTLSLNAFFKFDQRRNRIEREPAFFDPGMGGQDYPLLKSVRTLAAGTEFVYRLPRMNRVSLGLRGDWIDRDLDFPSSGLTRQNTMVHEETETWTTYVKTVLRPARRLNLSGELGFRNSPDTGYIRELENAGYGKLNVSYTVPLARPVTLSFFGNREVGENDDFTQFGSTAGNAADRKLEVDRFSYGVTITGSPCDGATLFGSASQHKDAQDFLLWTNPARFSGLDFTRGDALDYRARTSTAILGGVIQINKKTDATLSYSFTRSNWRFESDNGTSTTIDSFSRIRSDIQTAQLEVGHWLRDGLRLSGGYRFDKYRDRTNVSTGTGTVSPFSPSTRQHTVSLAVTLNGDLLRKP